MRWFVRPTSSIRTRISAATIPRLITLIAQMRTNQPMRRGHNLFSGRPPAVINGSPRRLSPFRERRNRTTRCIQE
jgi:hypothetical protein